MLDRRSALTVAAFALVPTSLAAHPATPRPAAAATVERELMVFRETLAAALQAKDVAKLKALYTEDFTHTHGSGKVDGRDARIVSLLAGEPVIETAPLSEVSVRVPGSDIAILAAKSPILNVRENRPYDFRWMQVFVKTAGQWRLAASQATRLPPAV
jgi:ketosteroid isomerase-like protein